MGKLRNFLKSSSQKDKSSLTMKNFGTKKSREGGSQAPFQRWAHPKPLPDSPPSSSDPGNEHLPCPPVKHHCFTAAGLPSTQNLAPHHAPRHPRIPGLVSLTQKVSMPSDELQGYKRCLQLTAGQLRDMPLGPGLKGGLSFPRYGKWG